MAQAEGVVAVAESPANERLRHVALLLALASLLFFLGLGSLGLTDRDEGSNAEAAREMVETGDWISPTLNYEPRFAKPAFVYWLMSGAYLLLGPSEFSARLPSAFFGVALILLQYFFLARVREPVLALMGGLMLLLNVEIVAIGRTAIMDSTLIFFTTSSLYCFWLGLHGEGRARHSIWGLYIGMALATLTKGPVGFLVPMLVIATYLTLTHRWQQFWRDGFPIAGTCLLLLLAVPWYAAMLAIHGSAYTASASANTIGRFLNVIGGHGGTILFYFPILAFGFFPWSGFLLMALVQAWKAWRSDGHEAAGKAQEGTPELSRPPSSSELEIFAAAWLIIGFLFFSLSATRLPHYIGPLYPAAAILAASYLSRCLRNSATPGLHIAFRTTMVLGYLLGFFLAAGPALYATFLDQVIKEFPMAAQVSPGLSPVVAGVVVVIGTIVIGYFGRSEERRSGAFWAGGITIGLVLLIVIRVSLPHFSEHFIAPPQQLAYIAGENLGEGDRLILYGRTKPSFIFYAKRKAILITPGQESAMAPYLTQPGRTMILLPARLEKSLPTEARDYTPLLSLRGYTLLSNKPMVDTPPRPPQSSAPPPNPHGNR